MLRGWLPLVLMALASVGWQTASQRRDPLEYVRIMESAERVRKLQVNRVVQALEVKPGSVVADLGAGSGLFSRPLARKVGPHGAVYAIDIDRALLDHVEETAHEQNLRNIRTVLAGEYDPRIPEKVDLVLICDTLHQIRDPEGYLKNLTRYLKDAARIAVIDYEKNWPMRFDSAKFSVTELDAWMRSAGCLRDESFRFLEDNFFIVYRFHAPES